MNIVPMITARMNTAKLTAKRIKPAGVLGGVLAGAVLLSACGSSYSREEYISEFQGGGLSEEVSVCIVDKLEVQIGTDKLGGSASGLTDEDQKIIADVAVECALGG